MLYKIVKENWTSIMEKSIKEYTDKGWAIMWWISAYQTQFWTSFVVLLCKEWVEDDWDDWDGEW